MKHNNIGIGHGCSFSLRRILFTVAIALLFSLSSCRTIREVEIQYDTVVQTDTTEVYVHDTTKIVEVRIDSVDREVEKITYVDSNGVVHEKEKETLIHYIYQQSEEYKVKEAEYKSKISNLEKKLAEKQKVEYVEKDLSWWQTTFIWIGVITTIMGIVVLVLKTKSWWLAIIKKIFG